LRRAIASGRELEGTGRSLSGVRRSRQRHALFEHAILDEARDVFSRPATRKRFPKLTEEKSERFLLKVASIATLINDVPTATNLPRDPKDEAYLNLAIATQSSFLVTRDRDLLDLRTDEGFQGLYPWLTIIDPQAFAAHIRAEVARQLGYE